MTDREKASPRGVAILDGSTEDSGTFVIHGVALGENDTTHKKKKKRWMPSAMDDIAESLQGSPLTKKHTDDPEAVIGTVTDAGYDEGVGVVYEAELDNGDLAEKVQNGRLAVSPRIYHPKTENLEKDDEGAYMIERGAAEHLALVQRGEAPSNSVAPGEAAALTASEIRDTLVDLEYEFEEGDLAEWDASGGTTRGRVMDRKQSGSYSDRIDGDVTINASEQDPAYLLQVYQEGEDGEGGMWVVGEKVVGHRQSELREWDIDEDRVEEMSKHYGSGTDSSNMVDVDGTEVDLTPPDKMVNAAEAAMEAEDEGMIPDSCGTGRGDQRAEQIASGDLSWEDFVTRDNGTPIPAYLNSHAEDVTAEDTPTSWSEDEWSDCGNAQYAKWGGVGDGSALEWAMETANEIARARGNSEPYDAMDMSGVTSWTAESVDLQEVPDEFRFDNPQAARAKADEMGMDGSDIHQHGEGDESVFMPGESHDALVEFLMDEGMMDSEDMEMSETAGVMFQDTEGGELDESEIPNEDYENHYLYPADTKSESSYPVVDGDGMLRRGNVDAAHQLGCRGRCDDPERHDERVMQLAQQFDNPPVEMDDEEMSGTDIQILSSDDLRGGASSEFSDTNSGSEKNMDENYEELAEEASDLENPVVVEESEVEDLRSEVQKVKEGYAEDISTVSPFEKEELTEKFTVEELRAKHEGLVEEGEVEDLTPDPQSGDPDSGGKDADGSEDGFDVSDLSGEAKEHYEVAAEMSGRASPIAQTELENRAEKVAELTGVDTETVLEEV